MTDRPILFSGAMVCALLDGSKTQTRRAVKITHRTPGLAACLTPPVGAPRPGTAAELCPHGRPGDRLWVRETFFAYGRWETRFSAKKKRDEWHFLDRTVRLDRAYQFAADNPDLPRAMVRGGATVGWYKRPAIFIPRTVSRILLEIVSVRVERLNECGEADARAEGATLLEPANHLSHGGWSHDGHYVQETARESYEKLWDEINGAGAWAANPWVWVIEFKRAAP